MPLPSAALRGLEPHPGDALDLRRGVLAGVVSAFSLAAAVAEVDAPRELTDHEQVRAGDSLWAQRTGVQECPAGAHGTQVRVQAKPLPQSQEALLGSGGGRIGRLPLRASHCPQEHGVRSAAGVEDVARERRSMGVDRGTAYSVVRELELAEPL